MYFIGNIIIGIASVLDWILTFYIIVIAVRALLSWVSPDPYNPIVKFLVQVTEPVLRPLRKLIPVYKIGLDITPIIAFLIILFIQQGILPSLFRFGRSLL